MKTRRLGQALAVLVIVVGSIGSLGNPAPADDAESEITGGTLDYYASDSTLYASASLGPAETQCSTKSGAHTMSPTHVWTEFLVTHVSRVLGGVHYTIDRTMTSTGTSSNAGNKTATISYIESFYRNNSTCTRVTAVPCTVTVTGVQLSGTSTITNGVMEVSDTSVLSGDNGEHGDFGFETAVSGADCGALSALDDGSVVITDLVTHITG